MLKQDTPKNDIPKRDVVNAEIARLERDIKTLKHTIIAKEEQILKLEEFKKL